VTTFLGSRLFLAKLNMAPPVETLSTHLFWYVDSSFFSGVGFKMAYQRRYKKTFKRRKVHKGAHPHITTDVTYRANPPQFTPDMPLIHRFRYQAQSASTTGINIFTNNISRCLMFTVTGSTNAWNIFGGFKIISIEIWNPPVNLNSGASQLENQVAVTWFGQVTNTQTLGGVDKTVCATGMAGGFGSHLYTKPPPMSGCSMWFMNSNSSTNQTALFALPNTVKGAYLDIVLALRMELSSNAVVLPVLNSTGYATGSLLGRLDGNASTGIWAAVAGNADVAIE